MLNSCDPSTSCGCCKVVLTTCDTSRCASCPLTSRNAKWTGVCQTVLARVKVTLRFLLVFFVLLTLAESVLTVAVYMGYSGGTYLRRVRWHNGSLTLDEFREGLQRGLQPPVPDTDSWMEIKTSDVENENNGGQLVTTVDPEEVYDRLPPCPLLPPAVEGRLKVDLSPPPSWQQLEEEFWMLREGGRYRPTQCHALQKLAIILPYRDRRTHLKMFLRYMHPFLQRQQLDYTIFVVELEAKIDFNRAALFNIGYREALKVDNYTCFIFHDVDLLPEDDRNLYRCSPEAPRHMSVAVDRMKYILPYKTIFGGVSAMTTGQFEKVNGFSNMYFGWGGEDDDMYRRIRSHGYTVQRYKNEVARYSSMAHAKADKSPSRLKLLHEGPKRFRTDGLKNLNYTRLDYVEKKLYTWLLVSLDKEAILGDSSIKLAGNKARQQEARIAASKLKAEEKRSAKGA